MTSRLTLHTELLDIFEEDGRTWMTTQDLADAVNRRNRYHKRDGSAVTAFQVHGRTKNYSKLFERDGQRVRVRRAWYFRWVARFRGWARRRRA